MATHKRKQSALAKPDKDQRWRQRLIRWGELIREIDRVGELIDDAVKEGLITEEQAHNAWEGLQDSQGALYSDGIPE